MKPRLIRLCISFIIADVILGSVDISTESDKSGDKTQKSKITGS